MGVESGSKKDARAGPVHKRSLFIRSCIPVQNVAQSKSTCEASIRGKSGRWTARGGDKKKKSSEKKPAALLVGVMGILMP